jgi:hypothetical protein
MKGIFGLFAFLSILAVPSLAYGADQIGICVAPKFIYGYARADDAKTVRSATDGSESDRSTSKIAGLETWSGSVAFGYNFNKSLIFLSQQR